MRIVLSALLTAMLFGPATFSQETAPRDGMFINIKTAADNAHSALMGLNLADRMSKTHDVAVFFSIKGIDLTLLGAVAVRHENFSESNAVIDSLIAHNVPLYACPMCLKAAGKTEADLKPGIKLMKPENFFDFTKGRIVTLDY